MNKYLDVIGKSRLKLKTIKMPKESFLDQTLSNEEYLKFKRLLHKEPDQRWYFVVWFLAAMGARISELVHFRVEHVLAGFIDIYSKGDRMWRLYFPDKLQKEAIQWIEKEERSSIETTRIYLQRSSLEQGRMVDMIVDW